MCNRAMQALRRAHTQHTHAGVAAQQDTTIVRSLARAPTCRLIISIQSKGLDTLYCFVCPKECSSRSATNLQARRARAQAQAHQAVQVQGLGQFGGSRTSPGTADAAPQPPTQQQCCSASARGISHMRATGRRAPGRAVHLQRCRARVQRLAHPASLDVLAHEGGVHPQELHAEGLKGTGGWGRQRGFV